MGPVISDIQLWDLKQIEVVGGNVLHGMKHGDAGYAGFGEAYFSWVNPGMIKAWKRHLIMTMNLIVPVGSVRFVFWGGRPGCFREEVVGLGGRYARITVPPGLWFGFQGISNSPSLILNIASIEHAPQEVERLDVKAVDYEWN
jgi:dTDP-4-dehydrorhamnose 3,5-epimerase